MSIDVERLKVDESLWPDESVGCWVVTDDSGNFVKHLFVHDPRHTTTMDENQRAKYIPHPEPATEWDDQGLPAPGQMIEVEDFRYGWIDGEVIGIDKTENLIVCRTAYGYSGYSVYRKIRTKAEREREELIAIITRSDNMAYSFRPDDIANAILAAGWQKPE